MTKDEAVDLLRAAGFIIEADELEAWHSNVGTDQGWDGWIRRAHPHVVATLWPD
jgi:hypothetical protein